MGNSKDIIEVEGEVTELLPNTKFKGIIIHKSGLQRVLRLQRIFNYALND